jgi:TatD DNase family protein
MLVDSHCHIDGEQFDADRDEVVKRAGDAGLVAMLNVGTGDPHSDDFRRAVSIAEKYDDVYAALGVHPHDAKLYNDKAEEHLVELCGSSEKVIAWGEIGLDFFYDHSPRDVQIDVFRRQIGKAREINLPIIIHSRDADEKTVEILTEECSGDDFRGGIMHCFGGTPEMAEKLLSIGFLISFAGNVTFKKAENLRAAARVVPQDKLLVETDCPFLTPAPFRGKRNEPAYVENTARFLAEIYGVEFEELAQQTTENFFRFFGIELLTCQDGFPPARSEFVRNCD